MHTIRKTWYSVAPLLKVTGAVVFMGLYGLPLTALVGLPLPLSPVVGAVMLAVMN